MPGAAGPLAPGQVYCDPASLADLNALNTLPVDNQAALTQSLLANPLTYAGGAAGGTCFTFAFPWIGTPDQSGVCQPAGGIPSATGTIISVLALGFLGIKLLGAFK